MMSSLTQVFSNESEFFWQLLARPLHSEPPILRLGSSIGWIGPSSDSSQPRFAFANSFEVLENIEHDDVTAGEDVGGGWSPNLLQTPLKTGSLISGTFPVFFAGVISLSLPQPRDKFTSVLGFEKIKDC